MDEGKELFLRASLLRRRPLVLDPSQAKGPSTSLRRGRASKRSKSTKAQIVIVSGFRRKSPPTVQTLIAVRRSKGRLLLDCYSGLLYNRRLLTKKSASAGTRICVIGLYSEYYSRLAAVASAVAWLSTSSTRKSAADPRPEKRPKQAFQR